MPSGKAGAQQLRTRADKMRELRRRLYQLPVYHENICQRSQQRQSRPGHVWCFAENGITWLLYSGGNESGAVFNIWNKPGWQINQQPLNNLIIISANAPSKKKKMIAGKLTTARRTCSCRQYNNNVPAKWSVNQISCKAVCLWKFTWRLLLSFNMIKPK